MGSMPARLEADWPLPHYGKFTDHSVLEVSEFTIGKRTIDIRALFVLFCFVILPENSHPLTPVTTTMTTTTTMNA